MRFDLYHPDLGRIRMLIDRQPTEAAIAQLNHVLPCLPVDRHMAIIEAWADLHRIPIPPPAPAPPPVVEWDAAGLLAESEVLRQRLDYANELLGAVRALTRINVEIVEAHKRGVEPRSLDGLMLQRGEIARALPGWVRLWAMGEVGE